MLQFDPQSKYRVHLNLLFVKKRRGDDGGKLR